MAFHAKGFRTIGAMGVPATNSEPGNVRQVHSYVSNDDQAAIETSNYFDPLLTPPHVKKGDRLMVSWDIDGTVGGRDYVINIASGHVVLVPVFTPA